MNNDYRPQTTDQTTDHRITDYWTPSLCLYTACGSGFEGLKDGQDWYDESSRSQALPGNAPHGKLRFPWGGKDWSNRKSWYPVRATQRLFMIWNLVLVIYPKGHGTHLLAPSPFRWKREGETLNQCSSVDSTISILNIMHYLWLLFWVVLTGLF